MAVVVVEGAKGIYSTPPRSCPSQGLRGTRGKTLPFPHGREAGTGDRIDLPNGERESEISTATPQLGSGVHPPTNREDQKEVSIGKKNE